MSEGPTTPGAPAATDAGERFALARRGLPLAGACGVVASPRAPWQPAALRSRALPERERAHPWPAEPLPEALDTSEEEAPPDEGGTAPRRTLLDAQPWGAAPRSDGGAAARRTRGEADDDAPTGRARAADGPRQGRLDAPSRHGAPVGPDRAPQSAPTSRAAAPQDAAHDAATRPGRFASMPPHQAPRAAAQAQVDAPGLPGAEARVPKGVSPLAPPDAHANAEAPGIVRALASNAMGIAPRAPDAPASSAASEVPTSSGRAAVDVRAVAERGDSAQPRDLQVAHAPARVDATLMGPLPAAPGAGSGRNAVRAAPASAPFGLGDLAALLAPPPPAPPRAIHVDRVHVAVQAPPAPVPVRTQQSAPLPAQGPAAQAAARPGYRNPWSSYFARRD